MSFRLLRPFLFQFLNSQSLKQLALSREESLERRGQQGFAEPSRTAQKEILGFATGKAKNIFGLVHIKAIVLTNVGERLKANG